MITLLPKMEIQGEYQYCPRNNADGNTYFADEKHRVFHLQDAVCLQLAGSASTEADIGYGRMSFHPGESRVVFVSRGKNICVGDFSGNILWSRFGRFASVLFSRDGKMVWGAEKINKKLLRIRGYDSQTGVPLAVCEMEDHLYDSALHLEDIPNSDAVTLELAAGQDGICVYRLSLEEGGLSVIPLFPRHSSYITPVWSADGSCFLSLENDAREYAHFSHSPLTLMKKQEWSEDEDVENIPAHNMVYLKDGLAVVSTVSNRYFLFSLQTMEPLDEIVFSGFEPRPTCEIYPRLADDETMYSQVESLVRAGKYIIGKTESRESPGKLFVLEESDFYIAIASNT